MSDNLHIFILNFDFCQVFSDDDLGQTNTEGILTVTNSVCLFSTLPEKASHVIAAMFSAQFLRPF